MGDRIPHPEALGSHGGSGKRHTDLSTPVTSVLPHLTLPSTVTLAEVLPVTQSCSRVQVPPSPLVSTNGPGEEKLLRSQSADTPGPTERERLKKMLSEG